MALVRGQHTVYIRLAEIDRTMSGHVKMWSFDLVFVGSDQLPTDNCQDNDRPKQIKPYYILAFDTGKRAVRADVAGKP